MTDNQIVEQAAEALEMLGKGYEPAIEIEAPRTVTERRNGKLIETERTAFVKIYTSFKDELKTLDGDDLKVWLYLALSVNRYTGDARPGLRKIAVDTNMAVNTVRAVIERLESKNLLDVTKNDGIHNHYRPSDYVSVKKETVSNFDTPAGTVSNSEGTVSKNSGTVSTSRREIAQLEELEEPDKNYQKFSKKVTDERREMLKLSERFTATLGITPDLTDRNWEKTIRQIVRHEEGGQRFEAFVKWLKSGNDYNRPKTFQLAKNPKLILTLWAQAFMSVVDQATFTRNEDGSINV